MVDICIFLRSVRDDVSTLRTRCSGCVILPCFVAGWSFHGLDRSAHSSVIRARGSGAQVFGSGCPTGISNCNCIGPFFSARRIEQNTAYSRTSCPRHCGERSIDRPVTLTLAPGCQARNGDRDHPWLIILGRGASRRQRRADFNAEPGKGKQAKSTATSPSKLVVFGGSLPCAYMRLQCNLASWGSKYSTGSGEEKGKEWLGCRLVCVVCRNQLSRNFEGAVQTADVDCRCFFSSRLPMEGSHAGL
ncbi:uncharacterized protein B0H64DRAFT_57145 [Chaetomium fimeti]|uniref:Uncharacterized protein n=1 Tax=Chaetomium fimeti TaxID=1854472 RepID=A0AAE0H620_9PEZI|nr:hypothetical protein B0H64DRAFT_57145 [Chaetomium fimeti]